METRCAVVLVVCVVVITATPLAEDRGTERSLRIGSNSGGTSSTDTPSSGYSVSFVPLFSLLANFFPRLFNRFNGVNHTGSREIGHLYKELDENDYNYIKINSSFCEPSHLGQWDDASNCKRFYTCEVNPKASPSCNTEYRQDKSSDHLKSATSQSAWHSQQLNGQHLQVEMYSTPCIVMTLYQCPDKSLYDTEIKQCVPQDNDNISKLCHMKQK